MGDIVNLRIARKRRARDDAAREADVQRARHGLTRAEKDARARDEAARKAHLDGHRRDQGDE